MAAACTSTGDPGANARTEAGASATSDAATAAAARILAAAGDSDVPPWVPDGDVQCKNDPLAHVHDPSRFELLSGCATVSGTVAAKTELVKAFGDYTIMVRPDAGLERFLPEANGGVFIAAVIPTDRPWIEIPEVGEHATFFGAWVQQVDGDIVRMHPAWAIHADDQVQRAAAKHDMQVSIDAPTSVVLGERIDPLVEVTPTEERPRPLERRVHLFVELLTQDGDGVAWKGGETNTMRFASVDLVALQIPGEYELAVHAWTGHHHATATMPITIKRS